MGASLNAGGSGGRRRGGRRARKAPMSEINVTPFVDVILVLLIIFMVSAPLMTVGVPLDLPQSKGQQLEQPKTEPLTISIKQSGEVFIAEQAIPLDQLVDKLKALSQARKGTDEPVFVRGDKGTPYGAIMKVMGRISSGGFRKVSLISEQE
ncbi:MAG: protein TolR [Hyphomicrobiaceae bacterium]|nr:protein TolR [Hyphomicrobiaceae bacterium]